MKPELFGYVYNSHWSFGCQLLCELNLNSQIFLGTYEVLGIMDAVIKKWFLSSAVLLFNGKQHAKNRAGLHKVPVTVVGMW